MKKIIFLVITFIFFIPKVFANSIDKISMDILIDDNGDAHIKETWEVYASGEGTEMYKTYNNVGNSLFKNFKVSLNNEKFTYKSSWDTNKSFLEKSYTNGINYISDGLELCWGISETGSNKYILEYTITNFVLELSDSQMVYWRLIPTNLSSPPKVVDINIFSNFKYKNTLDVWGYGKYGALAYVADGYINMYTNKKIYPNEHMTILVKFPKDTFDTNNKDLNKNFNYYLDMANKGAKKYDSINWFKFLAMYLLSIAIPIIYSYLLFFFLASLTTKKRLLSTNRENFYVKANKRKIKNPKYYREIPYNHNLNRAFYISNLYRINKRETDYIGAILLKWIKENKILIEKINKKTIFGNKKVSVIYLLNGEFDNQIEIDLHNMLLYSGIYNNEKGAKEFKKWCHDNYNTIALWFENVVKQEINSMLTNGELTQTEENIMGLYKKTKFHENPSVYEEAKKLYGLKMYLKDFGLIGDKKAKEVHLWEEYLMYAQIFGIAKKVIKQFKKIYPEYITNLNYDISTFTTLNRLTNTWTRNINEGKIINEYRKYLTKLKNSSSYSSGGGGRSSGGGGGGSFGSGSGGGGFR